MFITNLRFGSVQKINLTSKLRGIQDFLVLNRNLECYQNYVQITWQSVSYFVFFWYIFYYVVWIATILKELKVLFSNKITTFNSEEYC